MEFCLGTNPNQTANSLPLRKMLGSTTVAAIAVAIMEREMAALQQDFKLLENSYGEDVLQLVIASGYISKLIANRKVERYLKQNRPEISSEFQAITSATSLDSPSA